MINTVLLSGYLSNKVLEEAFQEIKNLDNGGRRECVLVIDSDGGNFASALEFVEKVRELTIKFLVKAYNAQSAAAFIALSLRHYAELKRNTIIGFHQGVFKLEAPDISRDGKVPERMLGELRMYNAELDKILKKCEIKDPKLLAELHGSGWLNLSAHQCLELGVVNELF
ncbi:MAG: hypothetical protein CO183_01475 [Candidatus Zambryskibacteria bacterium CG_4_9_14_3_um_filter_42_9]|uniref:Peptidase S14 n=1 Tax=Candidatus Zambryskibacteria bacterium CG22_combo_CG10-13_8_21_14_all_42_17 TaxID=1975118 RepID=A0A2H0BFK6_9BACT|nr:MAG: hypothetical protein COX06_01730 [Candidatus Zambryskibacteria bacterium CG22_combo_CG10-13_8_21_14_all_42_17]PJA36799.1 MAG: hypothetical protein CO183_01475 [Candidatus Zambryskibacteria bacterium CG_4_9_14_3_um_filter_42_9]